MSDVNQGLTNNAYGLLPSRAITPSSSGIYPRHKPRQMERALSCVLLDCVDIYESQRKLNTSLPARMLPTWTLPSALAMLTGICSPLRSSKILGTLSAWVSL